MTIQVNGPTLLVETYSAWDSQGRPTGGTRSQPGTCAGLPISLVYDDGARTISSGPVGPLPDVACLGVFFSGSQTFDADGNLVSDTESGGGTTTTTSRAISATNRICG
jgi:hypothetical protein